MAARARTLPAPGAPPGDFAAGAAPQRHAPTAAQAVQDDPTVLPPFDPKEVVGRYLAGDHHGAVELCRGVLRAFSERSCEIVTAELKAYVNTFVETVLFLVAQPDLRIAADQAIMLLSVQHVMANLVGISDFGTTDRHLAAVLRQPGNLVRVLFLYSARNRTWLDPKAFFDADPWLASLWYAMYPVCVAGATSEQAWSNLRRHVAHVDDRLTVAGARIVAFYFASTYVDPDRDRRLKAHWNAEIRRQTTGARPRNVPVRDRVAIVTGKWFRGSSVHRSNYPLVESLKARYRLTLVHLGPRAREIDTSLFDDVRHAEMQPDALQCQSLRETDFQLAFFPDIGMTAESVWLSNMRLAPIQATGYGHPATTAGSEIDYFIGGAEVELLPDAAHYYAERLVLMPGLGVLPTYPEYEPKFPPRQEGPIAINLPWGTPKVNYPLLRRLKAIQECSGRPVRFQFLPASGLHRYSAAPQFLADLGRLFGDTARVFSNRDYPAYMAVMERGDFALDSYPFGGYNTIIDSLHLGKPIVAQEGRHFFSRASAALLRRVGLEELVARDEDEYVAKAVRLAEDDAYRETLARRLRGLDLQAAVFEPEAPAWFCRTVDYLIANHETLRRDPSRSPIMIH